MSSTSGGKSRRPMTQYSYTYASISMRLGGRGSFSRVCVLSSLCITTPLPWTTFMDLLFSLSFSRVLCCLRKALVLQVHVQHSSAAVLVCAVRHSPAPPEAQRHRHCLLVQQLPYVACRGSQDPLRQEKFCGRALDPIAVALNCSRVVSCVVAV